MNSNPFFKSFSTCLQIMSDWDRLDNQEFERRLNFLSQLKEEQFLYLEKIKNSKIKISKEIEEDLKKDQQVTKIFIEHLENEKNKVGMQIQQLAHLNAKEGSGLLSVDV